MTLGTCIQRFDKKRKKDFYVTIKMNLDNRLLLVIRWFKFCERMLRVWKSNTKGKKRYW
jgi:hypothetical protein